MPSGQNYCTEALTPLLGLN